MRHTFRNLSRAIFVGVLFFTINLSATASESAITEQKKVVQDRKTELNKAKSALKDERTNYDVQKKKKDELQTKIKTIKTELLELKKIEKSASLAYQNAKTSGESKEQLTKLKSYLLKARADYKSVKDNDLTPTDKAFKSLRTNEYKSALDALNTAKKEVNRLEKEYRASLEKLNRFTTLTGFNINWRFLPKLDETLEFHLTELEPKIIRFPGGTIANSWDWEQGKSDSKKGGVVHSLDDLDAVTDVTDAKVIFVLNILSSTLDKQLEMLEKAKDLGIAIKYVEIGNELYLGQGGANKDDSGKHSKNVEKFPSGKEYAEFANEWATAIKAKFPKVKIALSALARDNVRGDGTDDSESEGNHGKYWNYNLAKYADKSKFDAYVYHLYIHLDDEVELDDESINAVVQQRADTFERSRIKDDSKEIWVTEYGVHANTAQRTAEVTSKLADYVEAHAKISMPQVLISPSTTAYFSLINNVERTELTALGEMFKERVN